MKKPICCNFHNCKLLEEVQPLVSELGLCIPSVHVGVGFMGEVLPVEQIVQGMHRIHQLCGTKNFVFSGMFSNQDGAELWGTLLRNIQKAVAGDEVAIAKKYGNHIVELHCKDFYEEAMHGYTRETVEPQMFAPIGGGVIRTKEIVQMTKNFPHFNGAIIIDQDQSDGDMMENLSVGFKNILAII